MVAYRVGLGARLSARSGVPQDVAVDIFGTPSTVRFLYVASQFNSVKESIGPARNIYLIIISVQLLDNFDFCS